MWMLLVDGPGATPILLPPETTSSHRRVVPGGPGLLIPHAEPVNLGQGSGSLVHGSLRGLVFTGIKSNGRERLARLNYLGIYRYLGVLCRQKCEVSLSVNTRALLYILLSCCYPNHLPVADLFGAIGITVWDLCHLNLYLQPLSYRRYLYRVHTFMMYTMVSQPERGYTTWIELAVPSSLRQ